MKIHGFVFSKWFMVWLHCKKDMELSQMIFRVLIGGKCLCDATGIIIWYIVLLTVIFTKFNTGCTLYNKLCISSFCTKSNRNSAFKFFRALILYFSFNCLVWRITKTGVWQWATHSEPWDFGLCKVT